MRRIIILDDDKNFGLILARFLKKNDWHVSYTETSKLFYNKLKKDDYSIALIDLHLKEETGLDIIKVLKKDYPQISCLILTAFASVETAVEAMKTGAEDYITKPYNDDDLLIKLDHIHKNRLQHEELKDLKKKFKLWLSFDDYIGKSKKIINIKNECKRIMNTKSVISIYGETGTGKEIISRAIHYESEFREKPFVIVNCATLQQNLLASELFGHEKGAYTGAYNRKFGKFEVAEDGTIFLDEIGELSLDLQKTLLRVLQEKEFERIG
ncbi:hypothetical protein BVX93_00700, partial [bacterium B13(2017)]